MDAASTSEAVGFITLMQDLRRKVHSWEQKVEVMTLYHTQIILYDHISLAFPLVSIIAFMNTSIAISPNSLSS